MRRLKNLLLSLFALSAICSYADPYADAVYAQIRDLKHPTLDDYRLIQTLNLRQPSLSASLERF